MLMNRVQVVDAEQVARQARLIADHYQMKARALGEGYRFQRAWQRPSVAGRADVIAGILIDDAVTVDQQGTHEFKRRAVVRCQPLA